MTVVAPRRAAHRHVAVDLEGTGQRAGEPRLRLLSRFVDPGQGVDDELRDERDRGQRRPVPAGGFVDADFNADAVPDLDATGMDATGDSIQRSSSTDTNTKDDWEMGFQTWGSFGGLE